MAKKSLFLTLAVGVALLVGASSLTASDTYIRIVQITYVGGDVEVARTADGTPSPAQEYQPLEHDALILTEDGVAEIEFENEIIVRLAEDSRLHLAQLVHRDDGSRYTRLTLRSGTATFLARLRGDDEFMVTTAYFTVLSERKARFRIDLTEDGARVQVFKGRVEVETPSETLQLSKGRQLEWDASNGQAALAELSAPDGWDEWNADRDDVIEAARRRERWSNLAGAVGYYGDPHYGHYHRWGYCPYYYGSYAYYGHHSPYYYTSWGLFSFGHYWFYPIYYGHHYPTYILSFGHGSGHHRARRHRRGHHLARHDGDGHHDANTDSTASGDGGHDDATIAGKTDRPRRRRGSSRVDRNGRTRNGTSVASNRRNRTDFRRSRRSDSKRARSRRSSDGTGNWIPVSTVGTRSRKTRKVDSGAETDATRRSGSDRKRAVRGDEEGSNNRAKVSRRERPRSRTNMARLSRTSARNTAVTSRRSSSTTRLTTRSTTTRSQARSRPRTTRVSDRTSRSSSGSKPRASRSQSNSRSSARASSGRRTSAQRTSSRRGKSVKRSSGGRRSGGGKSKSRSSGGGGRSKSKKSS